MNKASEQVTTAEAIVTRKRPPRFWILACAALAFGFVVERSAAGHREHEDRDIWFVHATDPHLFIPAARAQEDETDDAEASEQESKEKTCLERDQQKRKRDALTATTQEALNKKAFTEMLERIRSLPEADARPAFLVLTGDLGIDPCDIPKVRDQSTTPTLTQCLEAYDADERTRQISETAGVLSKSPVQDIYLVAGNNDIAKESAGDPALKYFNDFIQDVQKELIKDKSSVHLHNLTRCYVSGESLAACYADIPHSGYRLIGFPSYSFKKSEKTPQEVQFETFRQLWEDSRKQGMKALVITHTPEMDDPYAVAQQRYANPTPTPTERVTPVEKATPAGTATPAETATPAGTAIPAGTTTPANKTKAQAQTDKSFSVATWNVSQTLLDDWRDLIASDSMVGVFAGHLHDSHKEIYRRPYGWSTGSQAAFRKLFLAPPLAVKRQDTSPIQARGFSLVHLQPDRVESRVFWYDSETSSFTPDSRPKHHRQHHGVWQRFCDRSHATITWLWELGDPHNAKSLDRLAIVLIAILATFLTVVAIWKIPPTDDPIIGEPAKPKPTVEPSPFSGNFAGIIIAGLGGLAAASVLKSFDGKPSAGDKEFYIVWFVISFFVLLILSAFLRGLVEALRARFAIIYYPLPRPTGGRTECRDPEDQLANDYPLWPGKLWRWLAYRFFHAPLHWLSSLRVPFLTFADTFTNLIQGENHATTRAFADKIVDQQRSVLRVANTIRKQIHEALMQKLRACPDLTLMSSVYSPPLFGNEERTVRPDGVRVNISVLSLDQNRVFYISRAPGSSRQDFLKRSVAWVSVFTGKIRWFKKRYSDRELFKEIILFNNGDKTIADDQPKIYLQSYYQPRAGADYEAFVVFPVPWPQRGLGSDYVKGAIQISFSREEYFDRLWSFPAPTPEETAEDPALTGDPVIDHLTYRSEERMLQDWCTDPEVCATLNTSIKVLGEVLRGFNEHIYNSIGKSEQPE